MKLKRGFTLVEVCVVLAVVMILAALLFPVLGRVREQGRQASCQNNLRQIYLGLAQYVADSDSHFPNAGRWWESLTPYIKNRQVFICPSVPRPLPADSAISGVDVDYGYDVDLLNTLSFVPGGNGLPKPRLIGLNEAATMDISQLAVCRDSTFIPGFWEEAPLPRGTACGVTDAGGTLIDSDPVSTIHNGGTNFLFYNGQVKWLTPTQAAEYYCEMGKYEHPPFRVGGPHVPSR